MIKNDIDEWLQSYEHLSDEEIVASVTSEPISQEDHSDDETEPEPATSCKRASISHE